MVLDSEKTDNFFLVLLFVKRLNRICSQKYWSFTSFARDSVHMLSTYSEATWQNKLIEKVDLLSNFLFTNNLKKQMNFMAPQLVPPQWKLHLLSQAIFPINLRVYKFLELAMLPRIKEFSSRQESFEAQDNVNFSRLKLSQIWKFREQTWHLI